MQIGGLLGVEAEQCGGRTETNGYGGAAREIQPPQTQPVIGLAATVDALPHSLKRSGSQLLIESPPIEAGENLAACGHAILYVE